MFSVVERIIQHVWNNDTWNNTEQQVIYYICGALIIVFTCVFVDLVYRVFSHFWSGKK